MDAEREQTRLSEFLDSGGERLFRDLVEYHVKRSTPEKLLLAIDGELSGLPKELQDELGDLVESLNSSMFLSPLWVQIGGWNTSTCTEVFEAILNAALVSTSLYEHFAERQTPRHQFSIADARIPENQSLAFAIFQIVTESIAWAAASNKEVRRMIGIRKGLFG